jgi:hypothetical protein
MDDLTHTIEITIIQRYPPDGDQKARIVIDGHGALEYDTIVEAFRASLLAAGFAEVVADKLG